MRSGWKTALRPARRRLMILGLATLAVPLLVAACGDDDEDEQAAAEVEQAIEQAVEQAEEQAAEQPAEAEAPSTTIGGEERDFAIVLGQTFAPAGEVRFLMHNFGPSDHELMVIRTDLPADQLPLTEDGTMVDEAAEGLTLIGMIDEFGPDQDMAGVFTLEPGRYVIICNVPGHYQLGMFTEFEVTEA